MGLLVRPPPHPPLGWALPRGAGVTAAGIEPALPGHEPERIRVCLKQQALAQRPAAGDTSSSLKATGCVCVSKAKLHSLWPKPMGQWP